MACGNVGLPLVEAVMDPEPYDVLAVELSSFQLHWTHSMSAESAAVLNVAEDHLDWYAGPRPDGPSAYAADKGRIYDRVERACVYNVADPVTERLVREAEVQEGARAIGFTLGTPAVGMLGIVDDVLADRAFVEDRQTTAAELCTLDDLASTAPHFLANALAAAALARSHGVAPVHVREALRGFRPDGHRIAEVAVRRRRHLDRRLQGHQPARRPGLPARLRPGRVDRRRAGQGREVRRPRRSRSATGSAASVLLGRDAPVVREALERHAPDVPVIEVGSGETGPEIDGAGPMDRVVAEAAALAREGDTVLLAPGCASMDMFADYAARGDAFAEAVGRLRRRQYADQHRSRRQR